jgi:photosystem II stability/assembly factor-like uncharacterized protein
MLAPLISVNLLAQQPAWELVRKDFWGKIAIDPTNSDIIYVSPGTSPNFGMYKSTDGGKTWVQYLTGYEGLGAEGIVIDPQNPQRPWVYGGAFRGIVRSENGGVTAVRADTGIVVDHHGYSVGALAYDSKRDILYAGDAAILGGIYSSVDGGRRWQQMVTFGQDLAFTPTFFLLEEDSGWVYSGTAEKGVWRSKNKGVTWTQLDPQILAQQPIYFLARVPNSRTLYAASLLGNIYKSFDLGEHWIFVSDVTSGSDILWGGLAVSLLDTNYIFVGGRGNVSGKGAFYLSRDGGKNWQLYNFGLPQDTIGLAGGMWSLIQSPDAKYLYISLRSTINSVYKLSQTLLTSVEDRTQSSAMPVEYSLRQNFPNPFSIQTQIEFLLPRKELITVAVYDITGQQIVPLCHGEISAGSHSINWNGKNSKGGDVPNGLYFIRLQAGKATLIRKMLLTR